MNNKFHLRGNHNTRPWGWKYVKKSMALEPNTAMIRSWRKSSVAYDAATRMKEACPAHSEKVNE